MSGCHAPECLSTCCNNLKERLNKVESFLEKIRTQWLSDLEGYQEWYKSIEQKLETLFKYKSMQVDSNITVSKRLNELEQAGRRPAPWALESDVTGSFKAVYGRLAALESKILSVELDPKVWVFVNERLDKFESEIFELKAYKAIRFTKYNQTPHKCPVCDGTGKDKNKLVATPYDEAIKILVNPPCHTCEGSGVLWG